MKIRTFAVCLSIAALTSSVFAASIPVLNFSFENPGTVKIKGWNGENGADIPGWVSDSAAIDSGVESDWPGHTDGLWTAFMMQGDPSVWQLTSYVIQPIDVFSLKVDARDNWSAAGAAKLSLGLYYDNAGVRTLIGSSVGVLNGNWAEQTLLVDASLLPAAWGKTLGIELLSVSDPGGSWLGMDNVRLSVTPVPEPTAFALLGLGVFALRLRRQA